MKLFKKILTISLFLIAFTGCDKLNLQLEDEILKDGENFKSLNVHTPDKFYEAFASVEIVWKGGEKGSEMGNQPEDLRAFFEMEAYIGIDDFIPGGEVVYKVTKPDASLHREIVATVTDVYIDIKENKGWVIAQVISDTKGCGGNGSGGHDTGCGDDGHTDDGGCGDDGHTDDGGCGGEDDVSHDGGCTHDDTGDDGCADSNITESGSMGSGGNPLSGKNCRIGQIIAIKVHDLGVSHIKIDGLTWKWFDPNASFVPAIDNIPQWPHLCKKTILNGDILIRKVVCTYNGKC